MISLFMYHGPNNKYKVITTASIHTINCENSLLRSKGNTTSQINSKNTMKAKI